MKEIDAVLKIGGSLIKTPEELKKLCSFLRRIEKNIVIVPGGGEAADLVRNYSRVYGLTENACHWMAIKSMDLNGLLMSDVGSFDVIRKPGEIRNFEEAAVFLPFDFLSTKDELPHSWDVTSDSISLYLCKFFEPREHIITTNVDGIYREGELEGSISAEELQRISTCVDSYFPKLTERLGIETFVVSGSHPERIEQFFASKETTGTIIEPE